MNDLALKIGGKTISSQSYSLAKILSAFVTLFLSLISILAFLYLILGGFRYLTSGGDQKQVAAAKNQITYAMIGLAISIMSFAIVGLLSQFFGVKLLELPF